MKRIIIFCSAILIIASVILPQQTGAQSTGKITNPTNAWETDINAYADALPVRTEAIELYDVLTDSRDGNKYNIVKIGNQIWMAENLAYLPEVHSNSEFREKGNSSEPGYGVYGYDDSDVATAKSNANYKRHGVLYNWWAAMAGAESSSSNPSGVKGICPAGWHLPSDAEWEEMENYLANNGHNYDGTKDDGQAKIAISFRALPGGVRSSHGAFYDIGDDGGLWSSTEYGNDRGVYYYYDGNLGRNYGNKGMGFSVRCVRD